MRSRAPNGSEKVLFSFLTSGARCPSDETASEIRNRGLVTRLKISTKNRWKQVSGAPGRWPRCCRSQPTADFGSYATCARNPAAFPLHFAAAEIAAQPKVRIRQKAQ